MTIAVFLLALAPSGIRAEDAPLPEGTTVHPVAEDRGPYTLHLPKAVDGRKPPLLVALHESGFTDRDWAALLTPFAEEGGYALLCPRSLDLGFTDRDLDRLCRTVEHVKQELSSPSVHLLGMRDSARQAVLFALAKPRLYRSVVALGADVPEVRPASAATSLRLLVLKEATDRPAAGRESVARIAEHLEVAEFRQLSGDLRRPDPATRLYLIHFLDAAAGRETAGRDQSFAWREVEPGMAERARLKSRALVYLYDDSPAARSRTSQIQNEVLFDPGVRAAARDAVPIMAHRDLVGKVAPGVNLRSGPALLVLDEEGKVIGTLQRKISAAALVALLTARR